jgi:hypothetical protein
VVRSQSMPTLTGNLNEQPILHNVDYLKQMGLSICLHDLYSKWRSKTYTCELNCVYVKFWLWLYVRKFYLNDQSKHLPYESTFTTVFVL